MSSAHEQSLLAAALLAPDCASEDCMALIKVSGAGAHVRLAVYQNAYGLRLIEALEAEFPVLARVAGAGLFAALAGRYLQAWPSRHWSLRGLGHGLPRFLADAADPGYPVWWQDVARLEQAQSDAFDGPESETLPAEALAGLAPEDWTTHSLKPVATLKLLTVDPRAVRALADTLSEGESSGYPIQAVSCLVWREGLQVHWRTVDDREAAGLAALVAGASIADTLLTLHVAGASLEQAIGLLKGWCASGLLQAPVPVAPLSA